MNKKVELPLVEPLYSTYHMQGTDTAIIVNNPSVRNWHMNNIMILTCTRRFLNGYSSPEIYIEYSSWEKNPTHEKVWYSLEFLKGHTHSVIRNFIDKGYYVYFVRLDDYYIEGKTWYKQRHFIHDGLICGYDRDNKTYCIYAYDTDWVYRKFWTPQSAFEASRKAMYNKGDFGRICGIKPTQEQLPFSPSSVRKGLKIYLDSTMENYPLDGPDRARGLVVHDYIALYLDKLINETIPYEKIDKRVFRVIWEHKKGMLERIQKYEKALNMDNSLSTEYESVVSLADNARMLYASHCIKRRDALLSVLKKKLFEMKDKEEKILSKLLETEE